MAEAKRHIGPSAQLPSRAAIGVALLAEEGTLVEVLIAKARFGAEDRRSIETLALSLVKAAREGESLGFFPEGTFILEPGVGRFRPGAFVAALKADLPVVPIAISGTRQMLPSGRLLPRPADLTIDILPAIAPGDDSFASSKTLGETARQRILVALGEPDLQLKEAPA